MLSKRSAWPCTALMMELGVASSGTNNFLHGVSSCCGAHSV